jgi:HK97 family phage major capsid protein
MTEIQENEFKTVLAGAQKHMAETSTTIGELRTALAAEQKRNDDLHGEVKKLAKRAAALQGQTGVRFVNNTPFVSDDCARALTAALVVGARNVGGMDKLCRDTTQWDNHFARSCEYLGMEQKTAMTTTELPVPTIFVPQIVELIFAYGQARQHATVFPLGNITVKLPRLAAGEDTFAYLGAGAAGMSQTVAEKRVTAEEVTFTANKMGGIIRIPTELEADTYVPIGQFLARYIGRQFAKMEDTTMFMADGSATYATQSGIGKYCTTNTDYLLQLASGKTKPSDATLDDFRNLRALVSPAVLANMAANGQTAAAYYLHPSWDPFLSGFNKYPNFIVYKNEGGRATLDGWPIRWIGVSQAFKTTAQAATYCAFFGDLSYWYLGERGAPRVEVSKEVYFATDEIGMRALERIDVEAMATDAMATLKTAAS